MNPTPSPPPPLIRVLIVDDHPVVRVGLRSVLGNTQGIEVIGEAATGQQVIAYALELQPTLVLLDLRLPDMSGLDACRRIKELVPAPYVVFLTSYADDASVVAAIGAGADGYLLKDVDGANLPSALRIVADGGTALDPVTARSLATAMRQPESNGQGDASVGPALGPGTSRACPCGGRSDQQGGGQLPSPDGGHGEELSGQRLRQAQREEPDGSRGSVAERTAGAPRRWGSTPATAVRGRRCG